MTVCPTFPLMCKTIYLFTYVQCIICYIADLQYFLLNRIATVFFAIQGGLNSDGLQIRNRHKYFDKQNKKNKNR